MVGGSGSGPAVPPGTEAAHHIEVAGQDAEARRRRIRNWALLIALLGLAGLFYAIAVVRMAAEHSLPFFD